MPMKEIAKMQTRSRAQTVGQRIALSLLTLSERMEPISESVALSLSEPLVIAEIIEDNKMPTLVLQINPYMHINVAIGTYSYLSLRFSR